MALSIKSTRKIALLLDTLSHIMGPAPLRAIRQIRQVASYQNQESSYLLLSPDDYEKLCAFLRSTLNNPSHTAQERNTAAFILTCLKCNEYHLPYLPPPSPELVILLQSLLPQDSSSNPKPDPKKNAAKLFKAFVSLPASREARVDLTISDALPFDIFWSLLTYLPISLDMQEGFISLYQNDILTLIQDFLKSYKPLWPDNLQAILSVYFTYSSPENKTKMACVIWEDIGHIPEKQRLAIKVQCLEAITLDQLPDEMPTPDMLLADIDDLLAHNLPLFNRAIRQMLKAYNVYTTTMATLGARYKMLIDIHQKLQPKQQRMPVLNAVAEQILQVLSNVDIYLYLQRQPPDISNVRSRLVRIKQEGIEKKPIAYMIDAEGAHALLLYASKQEPLRALAWRTVKLNSELQAQFTPDILSDIAKQSKLSSSDNAGAALELLEYFHPIQNEQDQRPEQEKVQLLVAFVERFNYNVSDTLYYPLLKKAYTVLSDAQFVIAFAHYQHLKQQHDPRDPLSFDDKQRHANFLLSAMLTRCTDLLTVPLLQQMLETTQDTGVRTDILKKVLIRSVEADVMQTLSNRYSTEIMAALSSETTTPNRVWLYRYRTSEFSFQQLSLLNLDKQHEFYRALTQEERYQLAAQHRDRTLITIILQNTQSAAGVSLETLAEAMLLELFEIVHTIEHRQNPHYINPNMSTAVALRWIPQLANPAKSQLAQMIFTDPNRIQNLQSMADCRTVIDATTVEEGALLRFFDLLTQHSDVPTNEIIALAETFATNPQAQSHLARALLTNPHLEGQGSDPERVAEILALIRPDTHTQMHAALTQYLRAHLPVFAAIIQHSFNRDGISSLSTRYVQEMPTEMAVAITNLLTAQRQAWAILHLTHNTPTGADIMKLLIAIGGAANHWIKNLADIFPRLPIEKRLAIAQHLFETPEFFNTPADEGVWIDFISQYSTQLNDAAFNTLCDRLAAPEIRQLVTIMVNALHNIEQTNAATILLERLAQNDNVKQLVRAQTNNGEQLAYFRLRYCPGEAQEIKRDTLQVHNIPLLNMLCNPSSRADVVMAARLKLDAMRQTLNEHADNIAQLFALVQNTQGATARTDREAQCLGTIVQGLNQNSQNFVTQWHFTNAPEQVLMLAQFLLYPAVVKSDLLNLNPQAVVFVKQQEQAALDVLHKDKNWLSRAWEKFKYNVSQGWARIVASKTPHDALRSVLTQTRTQMSTTAQTVTALGGVPDPAANEADTAAIQHHQPPVLGAAQLDEPAHVTQPPAASPQQVHAPT